MRELEEGERLYWCFYKGRVRQEIGALQEGSSRVWFPDLWIGLYKGDCVFDTQAEAFTAAIEYLSEKLEALTCEK